MLYHWATFYHWLISNYKFNLILCVYIHMWCICMVYLCQDVYVELKGQTWVSVFKFHHVWVGVSCCLPHCYIWQALSLCLYIKIFTQESISQGPILHFNAVEHSSVFQCDCGFPKTHIILISYWYFEMTWYSLVLHMNY